MSNFYRILFLICNISITSHAQVVPYPQAYNLKGEIDHIQFFSLDKTWNGKKWEEQENNTIYFHADNRPDRVVYHRHRVVKEMNFEYQGDLLMRAISWAKDGEVFAKMEYTYENGVLKDRIITYLNGTAGMNSHYTYQYMQKDTLVGQSERKKEVYMHGRMLFSQGESYFGENYRQEFTYNQQGDVSKTVRLDEKGQVIKELNHKYEYDAIGNYIQKVTVDDSGDTTEIVLRKIVYSGMALELKSRENYIGKWLLVIQHPELQGAAFIIDFKKDNSLYCKEALKYGLTDVGRWVIDLEKQRIKVRFEKIGFRVNFEKVDDQVLQIHWDQLEGYSSLTPKERKGTFLYKIN